MTPQTLTTTPSKDIDFMHPLRDALRKLVKYGLSGFSIAILLCGLSLIPGEFGKNILGVLNKFTEHVVPTRTPFIPAIFFLGLSMAFAPSELAGFLRARIALPVTELAAHTMGVAVGVLLALLVSSVFIADVRPVAGSLVGALFVAVAVYVELSMVVFYAEGHLDSVLADVKIVQRVMNAVGLLVAITAAIQLVTDLSTANPEPRVKCAQEHQQEK